ncbi:MAG TPA: SMUG2 DNA glycosylase family protein [Bacteroidetes bacterium]|nr:SMUG2 DNA glycosylase family protein [Bacteroidota bacterium]
MSFAERVIKFNQGVDFTGNLPPGIKLMNPFRENPEILAVSSAFYRKFYDDNNPRKLILGINPGRLGAGATGIPFTDTKRLSGICGIEIASINTHEPSSVFVYEFIDRYGGVEVFYKDFFISSFCPLGFIRKNLKGNWVNCNYYDYEYLYTAVEEFMISSLKEQIGFGIDTGVCYILGKKNAKYFERLNAREKLFSSIEVLDHPRYIEQYRSKYRDEYINQYLKILYK